MKVKTIQVVLFLMAVAVAALAMPSKKQQPKATAHDNLALFKQLAGDWVGKEGDSMVVNYKVTSGGTAVMETIGAGTKAEMVTVIHADGDGLALTHYCMIGNQPQMRAGKADITGKSVAFKFVRATNVNSDKDMVMGSVTYTFVDKDTLKSEWTTYTNGKAGDKVAFLKTRKK